MDRVSIKDAKNRFTELARQVEAGKTIVVTRNGRPVLDLVPHRTAAKLDTGAVARFKKRHGLKALITSISPDFDEPLPENVLLRPLPRPR
jgi:prevent-host-death family protein